MEHQYPARRVTPAEIDALVARLVVRVEQPAGTTSTFVHLFLDDRFYIASGHSACVVPENFSAIVGQELATKDAIANARKKLWELEGYLLYMTLHGAEQVVKHIQEHNNAI